MKELTKQQAIEAMREGKKITHRYFSPEEYITIKDNKIVTEEGYRCSQMEFWAYRTSKEFETGWYLFE